MKSEPDRDSVVLQRCMLSVPASNPRMFDKALVSEADCVMLDCEDSVAPADKASARAHVIDAARQLDWHGQGKSLVVRLNSLDSEYHYRDVVQIVEAVGNAVDRVVLPRAGEASDIRFVATLLEQIEKANGLAHPVGVEALIETVEGAINVYDIASASPRLQALHFGAGDFAASCGARTVEIGGLQEGFPGDPWHPVMQSIVMACRANGLRPIDSAYGDFRDTEGYRAAAKRAAVLGFCGKWAIHPSQIPLALDVMSPSDEEVQRARRVVEGLQAAHRSGQGAAKVDGRMVDAASIRMAQHVVATADAIAARQG